MKKRQNVPAIPCPGCGRPMVPDEHEHARDKGEDATIFWTCENVACLYGPRRIPPGTILVE